MKFNYKLLMLLALPLITNCKKDDPVEEVKKGNIEGAVELYDEAKNAVSDSGMTVFVDVSSKIYSGETDTLGVFFISGVTLGTHTVVFEKEGYGTYKVFDVVLKDQYKTVALPATPQLGMLSQSEVTNLVQVVQGTDVRFFVSTFPKGSSANLRYVRMFYSKQATVSSSEYEGYSDVFVSNSDPYVYSTTDAELKALGFPSGTTVYARAYGDSYYSSAYDDPTLGIRVFPNVNPTAANAVSFVVP